MTSSPSDNQPADPTVGFTYDDCRIKRRGDLINLTDMWIANGRPENKRPNDWSDFPNVIEFQNKLRVHLSDEGNVKGGNTPFDNLIETIRGGKSPGTWAHWQLALVYAHYLSPEFYIWCNNVVHNAMLLHGGPPSGPEMQISIAFEEHFGRLHRRFDVLAQYAMDNLLLASAIQQAPGKELAFTDRTKRIIRAVIASDEYDGQCPCCSRVQVLTGTSDTRLRLPEQEAEFDHFYGPALNRPEHGWLICKQCHDDFSFGSPLLRFGAIQTFHRFQSHVLDHLMRERSRLN